MIAAALAASGVFTACETQDLEKVGDQGVAAQKSEQLATLQKTKANKYRKAAKILADL